MRDHRHTPLNWVKEDGIVRSTWEGFLGVHPLDLYAYVPRPVQVADAEIINTWSWNDTTHLAMPAWKQCFDTVYAITQHHEEQPGLDRSGFFVRVYDSNPPRPAWHETGLYRDLRYWRASALQPHYSEQNANVRTILQNWWAHVTRVSQWLERISDAILAPV